MIVQQLNQIQSRHGYLPRESLVALAERLAVPLYRIEEVVSFFPHYRKTPPPEVEVHVCRDMSCHLRGSSKLIADWKQDLATDIAAGRASVCGVSCLGRCDRAPAVRIHQHHAGSESRRRASRRLLLLRPASDEVAAAAKSLLQVRTHRRRSPTTTLICPMLRQRGRSISMPGKPREERYQALKRVIEAIRRGTAAGDAERDRIIQSALKNAVLLGMGGAGGQAFKKWCEVREAVGERKYVVCNADESEPGTFKDRELLLRTPYLVVEGVLLAGIVLGATQGYIYIRHEYEECIASVREEIAWAEQQGLCGDDILGSGVDDAGRGVRQSRRLHLRRADGPDSGHRRQAGGAAKSAAGVADQRPVGHADAGQQRRDAGLGAGDCAVGRSARPTAGCRPAEAPQDVPGDGERRARHGQKLVRRPGASVRRAGEDHSRQRRRLAAAARPGGALSGLADLFDLGRSESAGRV